jgi:type IV secretory pathway VirJ component
LRDGPESILAFICDKIPQGAEIDDGLQFSDVEDEQAGEEDAQTGNAYTQAKSKSRRRLKAGAKSLEDTKTKETQIILLLREKRSALAKEEADKDENRKDKLLEDVENLEEKVATLAQDSRSSVKYRRAVERLYQKQCALYKINKRFFPRGPPEEPEEEFSEASQF